ncbi:MAG: DNA polymerase III subunit alpha [Aggregatilineales bacterium]
MTNDPPGYIELHCHSNFSLLDGASHPEDLVKRAAELAMPALALTDHNALYGAVRFSQAAKQYGIRPLFGAELTLDDNTHLTVLVVNDQGWYNLCSLLTLARNNAPKGQALLPPGVLPDYATGLITLSGCRHGAIAKALLANNWQQAVKTARQYMDWFGPDRFFIELQHHRLTEDDRLVYKLFQLANRLNLPYVATNNVHYAAREASALQDVLVCIGKGVTLDNSRAFRRPNSEYFLKSPQEMRALFSAYPDALGNTLYVADLCTFDLKHGLQELPAFATPDHTSAASYLANLCHQALLVRLPDAPARAHEQLAYELSVIAQCGLENYFLVVWDIVRFANEQGILNQGRGSAANSMVAYLLGISPINPLTHNLVFERFLSPERASTPDIDIDFQANRREEIIQYVFEKYGLAHAAMACTFVTFQSRMTRREVGKALGIPLALIEEKANLPPGQQRPSGPTWQQYEALCQQILDFPRHLSIHSGGMVISKAPLAERVPTEPAAMAGRFVVQWDKTSLEIMGVIKIDILGLRVLSAIAGASQTLADINGTAPNLAALSPTDPAIYQMLAEADTVGVFQVESRAQAQVLPQLLPRTFEDIVVSISLIRPGPIQGNMVHPFLRRRLGYEPVTYPHAVLESALAETLGVILFQEQVIKVAHDMSHFSPGQGELLRRTLGGKGGPKGVEKFQTAFLEGAHEQGVSYETAAHVFEQLKAFAGYSFPKSHAAAFAVLVYQSAWLKRYHTAAYLCAILNEQPMGFWSPAVIVNDARRHGVTVLPVSIHRSQADCVLEGPNIRLGLQYVAYLTEKQIQTLIAAREERLFSDLPDFLRRVSLPRPIVENLILIGAMDEWGVARRQLLWELGERFAREGELPLVFPVHNVDLPPLSRRETLQAEYVVLGLSPGDHVMGMYQEALREQGILGSRELNAASDGSMVRIAGQVTVHQAPPTAKGFHFVTLEDADGMMNIIVRPNLYEKYRFVLRTSPLLIVTGEVQKKGTVVNVIGQHIATL